MKLHREKAKKDKDGQDKRSKSKKKNKEKEHGVKKRKERKERDKSSKKRKHSHEHDSAAFWDSLGDGVEADEVFSWQPLSLQWASMSKRASESQVPVYTSPEEALKYLPVRFSAFQQASWPSEPSEKCAALAAIAKIIMQFERSDLVHFMRCLELTLLERKGERSEGDGGQGPSLRPKPLFPEAKQLPRPKVVRRPPPPPATRPALPSLPPEEPKAEQAPPELRSAKPAKSAQPPMPAQPSSSSSSSSETETEKQEEKEAKAAAAAAQKKADAAVLDAVYDLCQAQKERPCHAEGLLQKENLRHFVKEVFAVATQPNHWDEAWRRTHFPQELRAEASQAFLENLLECATSEVPEGKDPVAAAALGIAALSRGFLIKRQAVEEFFLAKMEAVKPSIWQILSWLLFHWFPQNKTAGWGWWRVGWSWSEWWKVVERLLNQAKKSSPETAFKMLKEALVRMQEQKDCKHIFLKPPFDDVRRQMLIDKLSSLTPEIDVSTEEKAKEALAPLKFWQSR